MSALTGLEPASVFHYFEEICGIPHTSHHEKALSDYCVQFAKAQSAALLAVRTKWATCSSRHRLHPATRRSRA